jgi:hypothetical protein
VGYFRRLDTLFCIRPVFCCGLHNTALELMRYFGAGFWSLLSSTVRARRLLQRYAQRR